MSYTPLGPSGGYPALNGPVHVFSGSVALRVNQVSWLYWFVPIETIRLVGVVYFPDRIVSYKRSTTSGALTPPVFSITLVHQPDTDALLPRSASRWQQSGWRRALSETAPTIGPIAPLTVTHQESPSYPALQLTNVDRSERYDAVLGAVTIPLAPAAYTEQAHGAEFLELHLARSGPYFWSIAFPNRVLTSRIAVRLELTMNDLVRIDDHAGAGLANASYRIGLRTIAEV